MAFLIFQLLSVFVCVCALRLVAITCNKAICDRCDSCFECLLLVKLESSRKLLQVLLQILLSPFKFICLDLFCTQRSVLMLCCYENDMLMFTLCLNYWVMRIYSDSVRSNYSSLLQFKAGIMSCGLVILWSMIASSNLDTVGSCMMIWDFNFFFFLILRNYLNNDDITLGIENQILFVSSSFLQIMQIVRR